MRGRGVFQHRTGRGNLPQDAVATAHDFSFVRQTMLTSRSWIFAVTALALLAASASAQSAPSGVPCPDSRDPGVVYRTFYLGPDTSQNQFNEVQTVLRNMLQHARIGGVSMQRAIGVCGTPAELDLAQKIVSDMDHPTLAGRSWRLTYTFTHDGTSHKATLLVASDKWGTLKEGSRVPIVTGASQGADQVQYVDTGLNLGARIDDSGGSLRLITDLEQLPTPEIKPASSAGDPVLGNTELKTTAIITPGKPLVLGTLNLPAGGEEQVSVTAEPVP